MTISISISNEEDSIDALEKVLELMKQGFTSGYEPYWTIQE